VPKRRSGRVDAARLAAAIRERRLAKDWSQEDLAKAADVAASYVFKLETEQVQEPGIGVLVDLARALDYPTVDALLTGAVPAARAGRPRQDAEGALEEIRADVRALARYLREARPGVALVDLYRWAGAGDPRDGSAEPVGAYPVPPGREGLVGGRGFAVEVIGTSMLQRGIGDGDIVFVNPDLPWRVGSVVLALVVQDPDDGEPVMLVKEVSLDERGRTVLRSAGADGGHDSVAGTRFQIIGPVVLLVRIAEPEPRNGRPAGP
jgi:transcriptional regulator with XRE-family HTH domain